MLKQDSTALGMQTWTPGYYRTSPAERCWLYYQEYHRRNMSTVDRKSSNQGYPWR